MKQGYSEENLADLEDEELMELYQSGHSEAFGALYRRHAGRLFGFILKRVADRGLAEELLQETFLKVHRFRDRYNPSFPFVAWAFTLCRNTLIDHRRKTLKTKESERELKELGDTESLGDFVELNKSGERSALIDGYLGSLSRREREVLSLHYEEGFTLHEIALRINLSAANVRQISSRAIRKLKSIFNEG